MNEDVAGDALEPDQLLRTEDLVRLRGRDAHPVDDFAFFLHCRVIDEDLEQEAVALRFGERVDALVLDGVLRRHHQERIGHVVPLATDRDVAFCHHLEERGLHLGRGTVDLVGQHEVGDDGSEFGVELLASLTVDARADQVGGHQVRGELDAGERTADDLRESLDGQRLGDTGYAFEEDVPLGEKSDENALDKPVLPDDDSLDLVNRSFQGLNVGCQGRCCSVRTSTRLAYVDRSDRIFT